MRCDAYVGAAKGFCVWSRFFSAQRALIATRRRRRRRRRWARSEDGGRSIHMPSVRFIVTTETWYNIIQSKGCSRRSWRKSFFCRFREAPLKRFRAAQLETDKGYYIAQIFVLCVEQHSTTRRAAATCGAGATASARIVMPEPFAFLSARSFGTQSSPTQ